MARAAALSPEIRRAAILAATERLIVAQGGNVSTKAIAEAAGVAEGTIFRYFATKEAIIAAIFAAAFDRDHFIAELAEVEAARPLAVRLTQIAEIIQRRSRRILALLNALGTRRPPGMGDTETRVQWEQSIERIADLLEPDRAQLRVSPRETARLMQSMIIALCVPILSDQADYSAAAVADLLLNGIARTDAGQAELGNPPC